MPIRAVIFDFDGTITEPVLDFALIRREMGITDDSESILDALEGMDSESRRRAEHVLEDHEKRAAEQSKPNESVRDLLKYLADKGIRTAVLTRNTRRNIEIVNKKHGLFFDIIIDRNDGPVKPHPFGVLEICARFKIKPDETIVVGDYLYDLQSAGAAGSAAVLYQADEKVRKFSCHADHCINDLGELLSLIDDINNDKIRI